jgi:hypothetical protein
MAKLPDYSKAMAFLYTDRFSVYRTKSGTNANGSEFNRLDRETPVAGLKDVACRFSFASPDGPQTASVTDNREEIVGTVFVGLGIPKVLKGDYLKVTRQNGQVYQGIANMPSIFDCSQQIVMMQEGAGRVNG